MRRNPSVALLLFVASVAAPSAQAPSTADRDAMVRGIDAKREKYAGVAKEIWGFAEVGFQELKSSALLLHGRGGEVRRGAAQDADRSARRADRLTGEGPATARG